MKSYQLVVAVWILYGLSACNNAPQPATVSAVATPESSWALLPFHKADSLNPVLLPGSGSFSCPIRMEPVSWESSNVFNPAIIVMDSVLLMLYRAQDSIGHPGGTSRIGLALSTDGFHFKRWPRPVLYPDEDAQKKYEWEGGCEDPRIVEDSAHTYYMTYTAFDGVLARLMVATAHNPMHWTKQGPAFLQAYKGKYLNKWSKSGSIVSTYKNGEIIATRIHGKYWMYWGDVNIWAATSTDLIHWEPVEMTPGEKPGIPLRHNATEVPDLKIVLGPRKGKFDSDIVEPGPPAMLTQQGILLIYNGRNIPSIGDSSLPEGAYATGQALMDANDPTRVLQRMDTYFMKPSQPYEIKGQVNQVCFAEGLAQFHGKWFLYYGTADSKIAVTIKN